MVRILHRRFLEAILPAMFLLLSAWQLVGPVPTGLPDNGDFPKMLGAMKIGPAPGTETALANRYFSPDYVINERFYWNAELPSSEFWIAKAAKRYAKWFLPAGHFDLRVLGILHALILATALWLFLRSFRCKPLIIEFCAGLLFLFVFSDIEYVQFFSTAYADAAAVVFFCLFVSVSLNVWRQVRQVSLWWVAAFAASGCLFLTSKLQHQVNVIILIALAAVIAKRSHSARIRFYFVSSTFAFMVATAFMVTQTRKDYRADPIYALVFTRLSAHSQQPIQILNEFGIPASYRKYVGTLPFQQGYLLNDLEQRDFFVNTVTVGRIVGFYLHHPGIAIHWLVNDLHEFAPDVNLKRWGVHRFRSADVKQHQNDTRFTWWSSLRGTVAARFWFFIPLLYLSTFAVCVAAACFPTWNMLFSSWPLVGTLSLVGAATFIVASLNDCIETARHIILFQVATDLILVMLAVDMASYLLVRKASRQLRTNTHEQHEAALQSAES